MIRTFKTIFGQIGLTLMDQGVNPAAVGDMIQTLFRDHGDLAASASVLVTIAGNDILSCKLIRHGYGKPPPKAEYGPKLPKLTPAQAALLTPEIFELAHIIARRPKYRGYVTQLGGPQGVDDVLQEAVYMKAAKFDAAKGVPFAAYLKNPMNGIGGALRDATRKIHAPSPSEDPTRLEQRRELTPYEAAMWTEELEAAGLIIPPLPVQPERQRPQPRTWPKSKLKLRRPDTHYIEEESREKVPSDRRVG